MNPLNISVVQSDYGQQLSFTLTQSDGVTPLDLTGATVTINAQLLNDAELKFTNTLAVDVAASGTCHYTVNQGDFDTEGRYYIEIRVAYSTSEVVTFSNIILTATPKIPRE